MTDATTRTSGLPSLAEIRVSKWHGVLVKANFMVFATIHQSDLFPGYFHCEVSFRGEVVETKRPIAGEYVGEMLSAMLRPSGCTVEDLTWQAVEHWSQVLTPKAPKLKSVVYFLAAGPFIKIGKGQGDATRRVQELQTGCPYPITIMATMSGDVREEKALHRRFISARAHGEWFHATSALTAFIAALPEAAQ